MLGFGSYSHFTSDGDEYEVRVVLVSYSQRWEEEYEEDEEEEEEEEYEEYEEWLDSLELD
jgi:hypothetical protein